VILGEDHAIQRRVRVATERERGYEWIVARVGAVVTDLLADAPECDVVGVGTPGSVSRRTGTLKNSNTICLNGRPLAGDLEAHLGMPVRLGPTAKLQLAVDAEHPDDNTESLSAGAELQYRKLGALRLGWQKAFQQDAEVGLTAGGGVQGTLDTFAYRLDYAWAAHGRLGSTHRFALDLNF